MSKDITTSGPSRRSIAKGAARAVPAVSVAAAAPALAASPCAAGAESVTIEGKCPPLIGVNTRKPYFLLTNTGSCDIPSGPAFTLSTTGLVGLTADILDSIRVDAAVIFSSESGGTIERGIPAGGTVEIEVLPQALVDANLAGSATLSVGTASSILNFTTVGVDLSPLPSVPVAICG
uniref:Uncharacterized protein n=1 Tax=Janibacter limosus TaxID=53458 RepID=A0AC61U5T7_9MICO|nr:hypothetical protein [Janibacter limosus]